jgi:DNA-directed RNA polymerase specialized sigma24 family protein
LMSSDLLDLRWSARDGLLVPSRTEGESLASITNLSWRFQRRLSESGYHMDDLVQESFLTLVLATPTFKGLAKFNTYSDRVVRHRYLDLLDASRAGIRFANSKTVSLVLDGGAQQNKQGEVVEVWDHESVLLKASRSGWHPGMIEEDWADDLDDHALLALVDRVPNGLGAWWRMVDMETWEVVAEKMGVGVATAKRKVPVAWVRVLAIPEIVHKGTPRSVRLWNYQRAPERPLRSVLRPRERL